MLGVEAATGRPWLRCVWAQSRDWDEWGPVALDWSDYGNGGRGEWRARYLYSSERKLTTFTDIATGVTTRREVFVDIPPPRFCLERLIPPEVACMGWNTPVSKEAHIHLALTGEYIDRDGDRYSPRKPTGGYYIPLELDHPNRIVGGMIADHNGFCCKQAKKKDEICYGSYADPGAEHLAILEQAVRAIMQRRERRPGVITPEEEAKSVEAARAGVEGYWKGFRKRLSRMTLDALRTHAGLLSQDPTRQSWGKYSFVREGAHSKSGARPDEINKWRKEKTHEPTGDSPAKLADATTDS